MDRRSLLAHVLVAPASAVLGGMNSGSKPDDKDKEIAELQRLLALSKEMQENARKCENERILELFRARFRLNHKCMKLLRVCGFDQRKTEEIRKAICKNRGLSYKDMVQYYEGYKKAHRTTFSEEECGSAGRLFDYLTISLRTNVDVFSAMGVTPWWEETKVS